MQISNVFAPLNTGECDVLPVKIGFFELQKAGNSVKLNWITEQETNSKEFIVERSANSNSWTTITSIPAAGNSQVKKSYSTTDLSPLKGINFYRLKQVDINNRSEYSQIKSIAFSTTNVLITPNPASDKVNIYFDNNNRNVKIELFDHAGRLVNIQHSRLSHATINTSSFSKGTYILRITDEKNVITRKVIVN